MLRAKKRKVDLQIWNVMLKLPMPIKQHEKIFLLVEGAFVDLDGEMC